MKANFSSLSGSSSGKWWSKKKSSIFSGMGTPLDRLGPATDRGTTKTTITGGRVSEDSDNKTFLDTSGSPGQWKNGINKSVSTTVVAERSEGGTAMTRNQSMNKGRTFSTGSNESIGDVERGRPAIVHERF
jgi:hypothetical protein